MTTEPLNVLTIEDDAADAELLRRTLQHVHRYDVKVFQSTSLEHARKTLASQPVDLIFVDYVLGAEDGVQAVHSLRADHDVRPIIAMTGQGNERVVKEFLQEGADDYLSKKEMDSGRVERAIQNASNLAQRRRLESINRDLVAELKNKNEALEEKNRRLAEMYETAHEFVDNVSHEFRTPLTVIKEFTAMMHEGLAGPTTSDQKEYLATILVSVDDLATLIDDMLDMSRLEAGMMGIARRNCRVIDIVDHVRKILLRKAESAHVVLDFDIAEDLPLVYADLEKVGRIIINLTVNAIKFSKDGQRVVVRAKRDEKQGQVRLEVVDQGPGIDPQKRLAIFGRFRQFGGETDPGSKGFGLGLGIARELVRLHFADIDVDSAPGRGTTFWFTIPTPDPAHLIPLYLERIESIRSGSTFVSLVAIGTTPSSASATWCESECFLQHHLRRTDLLFPGRERQVFLVAPGRPEEISKLLTRLAAARNDANRNRPASPLPEFTLETLGTWPVAEGPQPLVELLLNRLGSAEPAHA